MFQKITRKKLNQFLQRYATQKRVLDLGSGGSGYDKFFPNRLTVDIDPERKPEVVADAHNLPFKNNEFEIVLCTEVLEHTKNPQQVIDEIHRILKPNGRVILTTRFIFPIHDAPNDYWRFTKFGLLKCFEKWQVIEIVPETQIFSALASTVQRIIFQTKLKLNKFTKGFLLILVWIFSRLDFLIVNEYGDIAKRTEVDHILTTGYYIVAQKSE